MTPNAKPKSWFRRPLFWVGVVVLLAGGGLLLSGVGRKSDRAKAVTFAARRGNLPIIVVENGSIEAQESQEVRSEVKGWQGTKLLSIVEEGYQVTEEDVRTNKVLVELDPSELKKNIITADIEFESKRAALTEAQQGYEIQLTQNRTDIKSAEQKAKFARLDVEKYLGDRAATNITSELGMDAKLAELTAAEALQEALDPSTNGLPELATAPGTNAAPAQPSPPSTEKPKPELVIKPIGSIDYSKYANVDLLGDGEAQQKLRDVKDALLLAEKERSTSKNTMEGTERLLQKDFVARTEAERDKLAYEQADLKVKKSATALTLFMKYEFPKAAEELVSKYEEAIRSLERTRKEAISKLAQAKARLKSAEQQYKIMEEQRRDLADQVDKCTIRAKKTGLVIYGGGGDGVYWYGEERIREGAVIRERQPIITIPDMTKMSVKVKIHESHVKKIKKGMKARIRVDAQAERQLTGEVSKVGVLPDSQNRWMNPDLKVYLTTINIEGTHDWLKPGMSAKVEVLVDELKDVVYVPIQAVTPTGKEQLVFLPKSGEPEKRVVEIGDYSDEFIEIKKGLKEGEVVLLKAPEGGSQETTPGGEKKESAPKAPPPARPVAPPPAG